MWGEGRSDQLSATRGSVTSSLWLSLLLGTTDEMFAFDVIVKNTISGKAFFLKLTIWETIKCVLDSSWSRPLLLIGCSQQLALVLLQEAKDSSSWRLLPPPAASFPSLQEAPPMQPKKQAVSGALTVFICYLCTIDFTFSQAKKIMMPDIGEFLVVCKQLMGRTANWVFFFLKNFFFFFLFNIFCPAVWSLLNRRWESSASLLSHSRSSEVVTLRQIQNGRDARWDAMMRAVVSPTVSPPSPPKDVFAAYQLLKCELSLSNSVFMHVVFK